MNMKLEVSKLMDHYTDTEFCPKENDFVDTGAVQDRVMAQATPARRKRRLGVKLTVAVAAAVACIGMMAAGLPAQVYHMLTGGTVVNDQSGVFLTNPNLGNWISPITLKNGRLYLTLDGEETDITDQIDENTPYIFTHTDPDTGVVGQVAVGGTPEDYGYIEFIRTDTGALALVGQNYSTQRFIIDGVSYSLADLSDEQFEQLDSNDGTVGYNNVEKPWYTAAKAQLGIEDGT